MIRVKKWTREEIIKAKYGVAGLRKVREYFDADNLKEWLKEWIDDVEIAGYENPIDEAYHSALVSVYEDLFNEDWEG